jgi:hypothetical protein
MSKSVLDKRWVVQVGLLCTAPSASTFLPMADSLAESIPLPGDTILNS